ncbi:MAG: Do family serine endopeptidase [Verrucomicrobiaceae bacterium]|nr:Do family serine endopeptidase [Verrucomicrobiaceae bacterium]
MKKTTSILTLLAWSATALTAQQPAPPAPAPPPPAKPTVAPAPAPAPAASPTSKFESSLSKDSSALPNSGQLQMSYANVAEKILPSVVTIFNYSSGPAREMTADRVPPQMREFFYRFFGVPPGQDFGQDENEESNPFDPFGGNPRRRGQPRNDNNDNEQQPHGQRKNPEQRNGIGSGIIITADGYILTNNHVVEDGTRIEVLVTQGDSTKNYDAEIIGTDPASDVAIIKINAPGLKPATIGDSSKLRVGDIVLAAGAPMELSRSITQGIVSALGRSNGNIVGQGRKNGYEDFIQTDASINPGNSGGPLVDGLGRVIGINTAILSKSGMNAGIGFAIPINMALRIATDLLDDGEVQRGFLGVKITDVPSDLTKQFGLDGQSGALVAEITPDSPAEKAGLQVEDIVLSINGQKIDDSSRLRLIVSNTKPGTTLPLDVLRGGKHITINVTLEELSEEALAENGFSRPSLPKSKGKGASATVELVTGVTVQNLSPALRERYDVPENANGVVVTKIDPNSRAAAMGLEVGDVISQINRQPAADAAAARKLAENSDQSMLLRIIRKGDTMLLMLGNN